MSSVVIAGNTSGTVTLSAPDVAGTTTLTLPSTSGNILTSGTAVTVAQGGTGATSLTENNVILGNGTSAVQVVAPSTSGNVLTSNGTTWVSSAPSGGVTSLNGQTGAITNTSVGAIGSYVIGFGATSAVYAFGDTIAGGSINYQRLGTSPNYGGFSLLNNASGSLSIDNMNNFTQVSLGLSGTWRAMTRGGTVAASGFGQFHLWVRVS